MVIEQSELFQSFLKARGLSEKDLEGSLEDLPDEALMQGIEAVAERIHEAIYQNEAILIFGHDDPDGVTSTYILYNYLSSCGSQKHSYYIPNRNLEPHGIQDSFIKYAIDGAYRLVITVDNGISAFEGVRKLNAAGIDVLITDHHLIQPDLLPEAYAMINPLLPDCEYPFKSLAGVGVVLILIRYLAKKWEQAIDPASYFWAAVGSIADKVPMIGVNRIIVRHVLENFENVQDDTVRFLLRNFSRVSTVSDVFNFVSYTARLVANGREENGRHTALRFILQLSDAKAWLFEELERQKNEWETELNRVFQYLETLVYDYVGSSFVYYDDDDIFPYSLLGTAATFVVNRLGIPAILLKNHKGLTVCEGRCTEGFNMVEAFSHCKEYLIQFGGHAKAAGFTMQPSNYDVFLSCFTEYIEQKDIAPDTGLFDYDISLEAGDINEKSWQELEPFLPWGQMNPEPSILLKDTKLSQLAHLNLDLASQLAQKDEKMDMIFLWRSVNQLRLLSILNG